MVGRHSGWYSQQGDILTYLSFLNVFPLTKGSPAASPPVRVMPFPSPLLPPSHEYNLTEKVVLPSQDAYFSVLHQVKKTLTYFIPRLKLKKTAFSKL